MTERQDVAARLEGPVRALLAEGATTRPVVEIEEIVGELDRIDALRAALERIARHGYQPMYNGRPSCPFCMAFIDAEETHARGCVLVAYLEPR